MSQVQILKDFRIAVVGGGMCGLTVAIALLREGLKVKVFEAASKFDEVGAGVGLGPNAIKALKGLGVLKTVLKTVDTDNSTTQTTFRFVSGFESHELIYEMLDRGKDLSIENQGLGIYRPTFLAALLPLIPPENVAFLKRLASLTELPSGEYRLYFNDGSTYDADLVIGADGVKSKVRDAVVDPSDGGKGKLSFSNDYIYRGMVPLDAIKAAGVTLDVQSQPHIFVGPGKFMSLYSIKNSTMINFTASVNTREAGTLPTSQQPLPWVDNVDQQELINAYKDDWGHDAFAVLKQVKEPSRWKLHTIYPPLESYVKDRIALIGDAAHAMVPYLGAGVGQGFEDAYVLYRLLIHPKVGKDNLDAALAAYDKLRRPRANMVLEKSLRNGEIMQSLGPGRKTMEEVRELVKDACESEWHDQLWYYDLEGEVSKLLDQL